MISAERLREVLRYDPETGLWEWLPRIGNTWFGGPAGFVSTGGYVQIEVDGQVYMAHRLAWFYMTGQWPPNLVDHEDTDGSNNRWSNLRLATNSQNLANQKTSVNNVLGLKCVSRLKSRLGKNCKQFRARIYVNGKREHLGYFWTAEEASEAYFTRAQEVFGEFARAA